jgi:RimJ/RimL family protein N-acetyltransferase
MNLQFEALEGAYVRLEPVTPDMKNELRAALDCDPEGWEIMSVNGCGEGFDDWWGEMQAQSQRGERMCFLIRRLEDEACIGTSSYLNIRRLHRGLEIGSTFIRPEGRSGPTNPESKRLLLEHAFDAGAIRVEFVVDVRNARSQAAVLKLGASQEGVLRNHKITWTGHVRDSAIFSITDYDWPGVRQRLDFRLSEDFV